MNIVIHYYTRNIEEMTNIFSFATKERLIVNGKVFIVSDVQTTQTNGYMFNVNFSVTDIRVVGEPVKIEDVGIYVAKILEVLDLEYHRVNRISIDVEL